MRLVIMTGRSAGGKSSVAAALAKRLNAVVFSTDEVRQELLGKYGYPEKDREKVTAAVYGRLFKLAKKALENGRNVILDGTFWSAALRREARKLAEGSVLVLVECGAKEREKRRFKKGLPEAVYEEPENADVVVDAGSLTPEECAEKVAAVL